MKLFVILASLSMLFAGGADIYKQKKKREVLDEIVRFISFVKGEIHYRSPDLASLFKSANEQNYSYLTFSEYQAYSDNMCDETVRREFSEFLNRLGTTDTEGQLALCDEYSNRFNERLSELKQNEKSKIQTSAALSILGSMCVLIIFI